MDKYGCDSSVIRFFWYGNKITLIWNVIQSRRIIRSSKELNKDRLLPGQMVSADHYISWAPVRLYHTKVKSDQSEMFSGVCVFIDHSSGCVVN